MVHFYRPTTRRCEIIDKHFYALAAKHMETKFLRVNAEKAPFLVEKLHIWMLPTIVCVQNGKTDHSIVGFDELGGRDDFATEDMEQLLLKHNVLLEVRRQGRRVLRPTCRLFPPRSISTLSPPPSSPPPPASSRLSATSGPQVGVGQRAFFVVQKTARKYEDFY